MDKKSQRKWYVVWAGRKPGIYRDWASCKEQIDGFSGARFKSFLSQNEAEAAYGKPIGGKRVATPPVQSGTRVNKAKPGPVTLSKAQVAKCATAVQIFVDGACNPNPGEAGSGVAVYRYGVLSSLWYGRYRTVGTNNYAELAALHYGLVLAGEAIEREETVTLFADSTYAIQCVTKWASSWEKKGWVRKQGPIQNLELIRDMHALYQPLVGKIAIEHVNGHVGIEGNELADRMSLLAINELEHGWRRYPDPLIVDDILSASYCA